MYNVEEFKEKVCENCVNKNSDADLCYITRRIDGRLNCHNENSKDKGGNGKWEIIKLK